MSATILQLSDLDEILKIDTANPSASIQIKLDDCDNSLRTLLQTTNIHKKNCRIFQYFQGLNTAADPFQIFNGEIATPIVYDEGEKSLSFTVLTKIDAQQVGFAPEEGQFASVPDSLVGKVWPLAFGDVVHIPAVKSSETLDGTVGSLFGILDYTLPWKRDLLLLNLIEYQNAILYYQYIFAQATLIARDPATIRNDLITSIKIEDVLKQQEEDFAEIESPLREQHKKLLDLLQRAPTPELRADVQTSINTVLASLVTAAINVKLTTDALKNMEATKEFLNIETQNAEYKYKVIGDLREKFKKMYENYTKTLIELLRIEDVMIQQLQLNRSQFLVIDGDKFPQAQPVTLIANGLKIYGSFAGKLFTAAAILPRYSNISIGPRQDTSVFTLIDTFWITDSTLILRGNYCLLNTGTIIKVTDQVGTKCIFETVERHLTDDILKPFEPSDVLDLPDFIYLQLVGASEHTIKEKIRILRESLSDDKKTALKAMEDQLKALFDLIPNAPNPDLRRDVSKTIFSDLIAYSSVISQLKFPKKAVDEATRIISQEEFKDLLTLYNLEIKEYYRAIQPIIVDFINWYYVIGASITGIAEVSPVILPTWLFLSNNQIIPDFDTAPQLLIENRQLIYKMPKSTFWQIGPGDTVTLESSLAIKYIANTLPSTIVAIYAFRSYNGRKQLVSVPSDYYFYNQNENYGSINCTTVTLYRSLQSFQDEGWEDQLYVSLSSSVGPNIVDIIQWIVETYTTYSVDATSFASVHAKVANYPAGFCLFEKKGALELIEEIAWQSRCVVYVRNYIVYIKYVSEDPIPVTTITQSDIQENSLQISYTETEELVTKFVADWKADYAIQDNNQIILRYNVKNYGEIEKHYNFYIYNIQDLVLKSATFWMIRYSNTWKKVAFKTFLTNLQLETLDAITLDIGNQFVSTNPINCLIDKVTYSSENNLIDMQCWIPIRAGEMSKYDFAFPAGIAVDLMFPTVSDVSSGNAGSRNSAIPTGADFTITGPNDLTAIELRPKDYGKIFQSDVNDISPASPLLGFQLGGNAARALINYQHRHPELFNPPNARPAEAGAGGAINVQPPRAGQVPGNLQRMNAVNTSTCIGSIDEHIAAEHYNVRISSGELLDVYEIGFDELNYTAVGTFVQVTYNNSRNQYEMIKGQTLNDFVYFVSCSIIDLPEFFVTPDGITGNDVGEIYIIDTILFDGVTFLYNVEDSVYAGLWVFTQGSITTRWSAKRLGTASHSEQFNRGQLVCDRANNIIWQLQTIGPITLGTDGLTYARQSNTHWTVRVAATINVDIAAAPETVNSITLAVDDAILLTANTNGYENGLYYFRGEGVSLIRLAGANRSIDFNIGQIIHVIEETNRGIYKLDTIGVTLDTTNLVYTQISNGLQDPIPARTYTTMSSGYTRSTNTLTATTNTTLTNDSKVMAAGEKFLLNRGTSHADNGIYVMTAAGSGSAPWTADRDSLANTSAQFNLGLLVRVYDGNTLANRTLWKLDTPPSITLNTTAVTFTPLGAAGSLTIEEVYGSPTYTGITKIQVPNNDGDITNPSAGVVSLLAASATTGGLLTKSAQKIAGNKEFVDIVYAGLTSSGQYIELDSDGTGHPQLFMSDSTISFGAPASRVDMRYYYVNFFGFTLNPSSEYSILTIQYPSYGNSGPVNGYNIAIFWLTLQDATHHYVQGIPAINNTSFAGLWLISAGNDSGLTNPAYACVKSDGTIKIGEWGTDPIGNVIAGGIITTIGGVTVGTVTSVALTVPTGLAVSGSPISTSGTLAITTSLNGVIKGNGSGFGTVAIGSGLSYDGTTLSASGSAGTVTLVATGEGLTGGPIMTTGTISLIACTGIALGGVYQGAAVADVYEGDLTPNEILIADVVNALLASLRASGAIAT